MIVLPYIHTQDNGMELRYMLRSLKNLNDFDGKVMIIGDKEKWFKNIIHVPAKRMAKPYLDQIHKMRIACLHPDTPDEFIAMQDDIYFTEPIDVGVYSLGYLDDNVASIHKRTKKYTKDKLSMMGSPTIDFEAHYPILVVKQLLLASLDLILADPNPNSVQWRSMYGNMFIARPILVEDKKTRTRELKDGPIISTITYTPELDRLFPEPSIYEQ